MLSPNIHSNSTLLFWAIASIFRCRLIAVSSALGNQKTELVYNMIFVNVELCFRAVLMDLIISSAWESSMVSPVKNFD